MYPICSIRWKPLCKIDKVGHIFIKGMIRLIYLHSPSKCLAWVNKCCHVWLDQNFDPSLLTNKLWLIFMGKKQKKNSFFEQKKIQNGRLKKSAFFKIANSQIFFVKISGIRPWVSRIDWCKGHWCSSTYLALSLSDISSKTGKKCIFCVFRPFLTLCWTTSQPYRLR